MPDRGRLGSAFASRSTRTGLIPYLTAGYPSLEATLATMRALEPIALAFEVGVPFSDPIADGPDIQRASEWALERGVGIREVLEVVSAYRRGGTRPVVLMTYANPILRPGIQRFAREAGEAGLDGVLVSDLPPDEDPEVWAALEAAGLDTVLLVAPTTAASRLPGLLSRCRGFVYCLARTGVTGSGSGESGSIEGRVAELRRLSPLPVAVGFGISTPEQARALSGVADAVVVGAALMREIARDPERGAVERVVARAGALAEAMADGPR